MFMFYGRDLPLADRVKIIFAQGEICPITCFRIVGQIYDCKWLNVSVGLYEGITKVVEVYFVLKF